MKSTIPNYSYCSSRLVTLYMTLSFIILFCSKPIFGQPTYSTTRGAEITIYEVDANNNYNDLATLCGSVVDVRVYTDPNANQAPIASQVADVLTNTALNGRVKVVAGETYTYRVEYNGSPIGELYSTPTIGIYTGIDGVVPASANYTLTRVLNSTEDFYAAYEVQVKFDKGTKDGFMAIPVQEADPTTHIIIPFIVEGPINPLLAGETPLTNPEKKIDVVGTTIEPQIPYLILHAPPGDGSSTTFQSGKTTCRNLKTNYAEGSSNAANVAVKIGIAGSAGLFVTTKFEFSVTFKAGLTVGDMAVTTTDEQTCISVSESFTTGAMKDLEGGGDIFIGYGTTMK